VIKFFVCFFDFFIEEGDVLDDYPDEDEFLLNIFELLSIILIFSKVSFYFYLKIMLLLLSSYIVASIL
jgi:hypothetical protein